MVNRAIRIVFILVAVTCVLLLNNVVTAAVSYNDSQYVKEIKTTKDVHDMILQGDAIWMVQVYDPNSDESKKVEEVYKALGVLVRGIFSVGVIDVSLPDSKQVLDTLSIKLSETELKIPLFYVSGDDRKKPIRVKATKGNDIPDIQTMGDYLMRHTTEQISERSRTLHLRQPPPGGSSKPKYNGPSKVIQLTSSNFNEKVYNNTNVVAVAFVAPWCGHCKRLLPEWEEAAYQLDGSGAQLGIVDATVETDLASKFNVKGYPTIKVFPGGTEQNKKQSVDDLKAERTSPSIVKYMLDVVDKTGIVPPISEMINEETLLSTCGTGHNQICIIAALPILADSGAAGRIKYRDDILSTVSKQFRGSPYKFLWYEYTTQPTLEQTLELTFGAPAIVAVSIERKAYALYRSSFSVKGITAFLHTITNGRTKVIPFPNNALPKIESVIEWDGTDIQPVEEEMSLEDIMGDEL
jgi:protein disulfide-isomerase A6